MVLIGFAEALAAIESAWCLRDAGFQVVAFARSGHRPPLAAMKGVRVVAVPDPETDALATVAALRDLVAVERPVAVLPLDDHSVWLCDQLAATGIGGEAGTGGAAGAGTTIAGPIGAQAHVALDKREQIGLAEKVGIRTPPTAEAPETPPGAGPWMVKSALAIVERGGCLYRPAGDIATDVAGVAGVAAKLGGPALVQPLLSGVGEGLFGFAANGEVLALSAHRRVRMMNPRGSGSSACRSVPVDPELVEPARRFLAEAGWHGIFMLELLRDDAGQPWFMELNGRAWGSMALARHRGLPYPEWAVHAALDPAWQPTEPMDAPHLVARHLGRELVHLLAVLRGARGPDGDHWPSRGRTLAALLRPHRGTRWYHARRGELRLLLFDTWGTVAGQVRRRR